LEVHFVTRGHHYLFRSAAGRPEEVLGAMMFAALEGWLNLDCEETLKVSLALGLMKSALA
jgi:hypothetical protein